jgi:hypothetical protein
MALKRNINKSRLGTLTFADSYARVVMFALSRPRGGGTKFMIDVAIYANTPESEDIQEIDFLRYHGDIAALPNGGGNNPIERAYLYLKTLPEFNGSTDV